MKKLAALAAIALLAACGGSAPEEGGADDNVASVRAVPVGSGQVQSWVHGQGTARAARREFLSFTAEGRVTYVAPGLRIGSRVRRGQLIANLEPDRVRADLTGAEAEFASAEASRREAEAARDLARITLERFETLLAQRSAAPQEVDQARAEYAQALAASRRAEAQARAGAAQVARARVLFSESRLVSPIDGVIGRLNVERGRLFSPQTVQTQTEQSALRTVPALVIDPSRFEVTVELPATRYREIAVGGEVLIGTGPAAARTGRGDDRHGREAGPPLPASRYEIRGVVEAIGASLDPETRTFEVIVRTTTPNPPMQDGEFVTLWIARPLGPETPAVPLEAVRYRGERPYVFVVDREAGVARQRDVVLGQLGDGLYAVLDGLHPGEQVVTDGRQALTDGQRIRLLPPAGDRTRPR